MEISRFKLYELVSHSPLSKVAPSLGVSATTLATICREHDVPYPGSGYWTRKSLGQTVELEPLSLSPTSGEQQIHIEPAKRRAARTPTQIAGEPAVTSATPTHDTISPIKERLVSPHALIAKWITERERQRKEALASRDEWRIRTAPAPLSDLDRRRHRILDSLFRTLEAKGAKISEAEKGLLRVTIDGERIDFQVREKNKQVRIPPSDKRSSYLSQELVGTGKLVFAIRTYLRGSFNEEWRDTDRTPLEDQLSSIINRLFEGAEILKAWHLEQAKEEEERRQEAARQAERKRLAQLEEDRRQKLGELSQDWRTATLVRDFIAALKSRPLDDKKLIHGKTVAEWILWAEAAADALDLAQEGAEHLFEIIGNVGDQQRKWW